MLPLAAGNHAVAEYVRSLGAGRLLQRAIYTWDGERWKRTGSSSSRANPPKPEGDFAGQTYDDDTGVYSTRKRSQEGTPGDEKRTRYESKDEESDEDEGIEEDEEGLSEELIEWMQSATRQRSQYGSGTAPRNVRRLDKGELGNKACFEWALRAFSDEGEHPSDAWTYMSERARTRKLRDRRPPQWVRDLDDAVRDQMEELITQMALERVVIDFQGGADNLPEDVDDDTLQGVMENAVRVLVQMYGFTVDEDEPAAYIVCHYQRAQGAGFPEHWWIELPQGILVQTVTDKDIEVGGLNLRWHDAQSARGRGSHADRYGLVRIGVRALKGRHVEILRRGMEQELARA
jgi:hypothetical protein